MRRIMAQTRLLSHQSDTPNTIDLSLIEQQLEAKQNTLTFSLEETKALLHELANFELGRFVLKHKGLDGYWTSYVILHGINQQNLSPLEAWFLQHAPAVRATRERFYIFQKALQVRIKDNMHLASIPCGLMDDLLGLDYKKTDNIRLTGFDLDQNALILARKNAQQHQFENVACICKDAWDLGYENTFDIITSNGLNIYQSDVQKVIALYQQFYRALKPKGTLITSFLTPSPLIDPHSPWHNYELADVLKQKAIFLDIIEANWRFHQTEESTKSQLMAAGFKIGDIIYDSQAMFPTIIAEKL